MRAILSPIVASLHGKAADVVAATWKGRQYFRRRVVPANPQSAAQTLVRESLARCVTLWRSLHIAIKNSLDRYGVDYRMSGYNVFVQKNRALEQALDVLKPVPDNPRVNVVKTFAAAEGAGASGDIDCTWVAGDPTALTDVGMICRLADTNVFTAFGAEGDASQAFTISGLSPGGVYEVYAFYINSTLLITGTSVCIENVSAKA